MAIRDDIIKILSTKYEPGLDELKVFTITLKILEDLQIYRRVACEAIGEENYKKLTGTYYIAIPQGVYLSLMYQKTKPLYTKRYYELLNLEYEHRISKEAKEKQDKENKDIADKENKMKREILEEIKSFLEDSLIKTNTTE